MTLLNQIVALEKGLKSRTTATVTEIHRDLQKAPLYAGLSRTYQPKNHDGDQLPSEKQIVQMTVTEKLDKAAEALVALFDVVATKELGNTHAKADVVVDGELLVSGATVPYLLFLEKQLTDWRTLVTNLPMLDPAEVWTYDEDNNQYRSRVTETTKTKKIPTVLVKAPHTDRHPAQTEVYNEDVVVGTWSLTKFSGAVPRARRDELVERANKLIDAVKSAREQANSIEVQQVRAASAVFSYLLA